MSHRRRKVDMLQPLIIRQLRTLGVSVTPTHVVGNGFPDLVLGLDGRNLLVELKSPGGRLTEDEIRWTQGWQGQYVVAQSTEGLLLGLLDQARHDPSLYATLIEVMRTWRQDEQDR